MSNKPKPRNYEEDEPYAQIYGIGACHQLTQVDRSQFNRKQIVRRPIGFIRPKTRSAQPQSKK